MLIVNDKQIMTESMIDLLNLCYTIPTGTIGYIPNIKPWIISDLNELLKKNREGNTLMMSIQKKFKVMIINS